MVHVTINERIKDLRTELKMSQQEFGELLGIPASTCSDYEKDSAIVPSDIIVKISEKCNVSSDYLLGITNTRKIENMDVADLYLSDSAIEKIRNGNLDSRIVSDLIESEYFETLIADLDIYACGYYEKGLNQLNVVLDILRNGIGNIPNETAKQELSRAVGDDITQADYFLSVFGKDLLAIADEIKEKHKDITINTDVELTKEELDQIIKAGFDKDGKKKNNIVGLAAVINATMNILLAKTEESATLISSSRNDIDSLTNEYILESPAIESDSRKRRKNKSNYNG